MSAAAGCTSSSNVGAAARPVLVAVRRPNPAAWLAGADRAVVDAPVDDVDGSRILHVLACNRKQCSAKPNRF